MKFNSTSFVQNLFDGEARNLSFFDWLQGSEKMRIEDEFGEFLPVFELVFIRLSCVCYALFVRLAHFCEENVLAPLRGPITRSLSIAARSAI